MRSRELILADLERTRLMDRPSNVDPHSNFWVVKYLGVPIGSAESFEDGRQLMIRYLEEQLKVTVMEGL